GIAIGNGTKSPSGIGMRFCANARRTGAPATTPNEANPETSCRRLRRNGISRNWSLSVISGVSFHACDRMGRAPSDLSVGEYRRKILPIVERSGGKIIRLAFDDRAQRTLLVDAKVRRGRGAIPDRHSLKRTVAF